MNSNILKIALLGLGKMGQNHLRILSKLPDVKIAFIYDYDANVAQNLANEYSTKVAKNESELENLLKSVDAVIIATPTFTHFSYIKLASKYVKNIFVEKPLCANFSECKELKLKNHKIQTGFIERYNPAFMELKNIMSAEQKKAYKSPKIMEFRRSSFGSSRIKDADVISDLMIHDIDLALHLNGKAKCVFACGFGTEQIDLAKAILKHENGVISSLFTSRITHKNERKITADFAEFFIECDLLGKKLLISYKNGTREKSLENSNQLELELKDFCEFSGLNFLKNSKDLENSNIADFKDGTKAIKMADIIRQKIRGK